MPEYLRPYSASTCKRAGVESIYVFRCILLRLGTRYSPRHTSRQRWSLLQCVQQIDLWRTGNKSPRAFVALVPARIPQRNSRIFTRKRKTPWSPSSSRAISRAQARITKLPSGIPQPRLVFVAPIGRPKPKKPRSGWVVTFHSEKPHPSRHRIFPQSLLLSRFRNPAFRSNKTLLYLKPSQVRHSKTSSTTNSPDPHRIPPQQQKPPRKGCVAVEGAEAVATAAKAASHAKPLPLLRNTSAPSLLFHRAPWFPRRRKMFLSHAPLEPPNPPCPVFPSSLRGTPVASRSEAATATLDFPLVFRFWRCSSAACSPVLR
jgi:hypothetical protein